MSEIILLELKVFLIFAMHGAVLGMICELICLWRKTMRHGALWIGLEDGIFWIGAAIRTFVLIFVYQDGELRLYTAAAMIIGAVLFRKIVRKGHKTVAKYRKRG